MPLRERTPEEIRADEDAQELRRASFTRARLTEEERLVSHGMQLEEIARKNIALLEETGQETKELEVEYARLAEGLALQGRYREAAMIHPDEQRANQFSDILKAIEKADEDECKCPERVVEEYSDAEGKQRVREITVADKKELKKHPENKRLPKYHTVKEVYSRNHGKVVKLETCIKCGFLNAR